MNLLYCSGSTVIGWQDSSQNIPASAYGSNITVIPWTAPISTLSRIGPAPAKGPDTRQYATPVLNTAQLITYAQYKQAMLAAGGITVDGVMCGTDTASLVLLEGVKTLATEDGSLTFQWVEDNGTVVTLTAAQGIAIFEAVHTFIQATFTACAAAIVNINNGTYTTTAQIDAYAWPVNS
jgi:hypothetical protein